MKKYDGIIKQSKSDTDLKEAYLPSLYKICHAVNLLELDNGDIICTYFSGTREGNPDTNIVVSRLNKGSKEWTQPIDLSVDPEHSEQNPVLFKAPNGEIWILHTSNKPHDQNTSNLYILKSKDNGYTWSDPEILFASKGIFIRHPIVVLSNGDFILPIYYCDKSGHYSAVKISQDEGKTWREYPVPGSLHRVQMNIVKLDDNLLVAFFRSRQADRIYRSESQDFGHTWSEPQRTFLPNNNSSTQAIKLEDGNLVMVYNNVSLERDQIRPNIKNGKLLKKTLRTPLTVAMSEDNGATWPYIKNIQMSDDEYLKDQTGFSYPALIQTRDGKIHVTYTYIRYCIKHVITDANWIRKEFDYSGIIEEYLNQEKV